MVPIRDIKRTGLVLFFLICLSYQVTGGIRQTVWSGFPSTWAPQILIGDLRLRAHDFLLLYGMFSPSLEANQKGLERMEKRWGGGVFAVQTQTEIWVELEGGGMARLTGHQYIPDPRDEAVLILSKKFEGSFFPHSLRNKGETPETIYGKEALARYNRLNPTRRAVAAYARIIRWPAGQIANNQNFGGVYISQADSREELRRNSAWGSTQLRRLWPK